MLVTDAHGGFGGIAQYNRHLITALSRCNEIGEIVVLPRIVHNREFDLPANTTYDLAAASGLGSFVGRCLVHMLGRRRFDLVICGHINLAPVAIVGARLRGVPSVMAIHGIDAWQPPRSRLAAHAAGMAELVIAVSETTLERFLGWCNLAPSRAVIVTNCVDCAEFGLGPKPVDLLAKHGLAGANVIMTFGRMSADERYKGFDEVIGVLASLAKCDSSIRYLAAGDGDDRPRLEALARSAGVADLVVFTGRIPEGRKADYLRLADVFAMPSTGEGFGIVVLEALACGIPVVASKLDGTREAVRDGELGLLVNPQDSPALEAGILEALSRPKSIPPGLDYFSFANFEKRLVAALAKVVPVQI